MRLSFKWIPLLPFIVLFFLVFIFILLPYPNYKIPAVVGEVKSNSFALIKPNSVKGLATQFVDQVYTSDDKSTVINNNSDNSQEDEEESDNKKTSNSKSNSSVTSTPIPTKSDLDIFVEKTNKIESWVNVESVTDLPIEQIFVSSLVDFYGKDLANTFNFESIKFSNWQLISQTEATASATVVVEREIKNYTAYFYKQNSDWFLYKTE